MKIMICNDAVTNSMTNWNVILFFFLLLKNSLSFNVFGGITYGWCGCQSCENAPVFTAAVLAGHGRKSTVLTENSKESFVQLDQ